METTHSLLLNTDPEASISLLALSLLALGFLSYHFLGTWLMRNMDQVEKDDNPSLFAAHLIRRGMGFMLMGVLPWAIFFYGFDLPFQEYGINMEQSGKSALWILALLPPIVAMNYYVAGKPSNLEQYPQIRLLQWDLKDLLINFTSWILYLLGYEMLFRGFLLFSFYHAFGLPIAVGVNVVLYALAHIPKGHREVAGSVPFGIVLCLITLSTGSFLAAFVLHALMALSNEFFAIRFHPDMRIKSHKT